IVNIFFQNYVGSIETIGENRQLIEQLGKGRGISYRVNLPIQDPLPRLTKLTLNGRTICTGPGEKSDFVTEVNLRHFIRSDSSYNKFNNVKNVQNSTPRPEISSSSGTPLVPTGFSQQQQPKHQQPQHQQQQPDQFRLVDHREKNHTIERTEHEITPTGNNTSYKYVNQVVTYKEYVSSPALQKSAHYYVNTTTREQV
ncbi:uncharacterized protein LOC129760691, partial [Uranotaenia lowii]|uniref:uncharacterized protein LOC129760691 n=1 Tax=Uranotaenia lowii TaxID=190385 RepID=UPI002479E1C9